MAKKLYIGNGNIARNVKSIYVGVNGVARKVKKGYIGVNGIARQFYESLEVGHYWLIDISGTKEYTAAGLLVSSSSEKTMWVCPTSSNYTVEIHGYGGTGGTGIYKGLSKRINFTYRRGYAAACGGAGGGSGAIFTLSLSGGVSYQIIIASTVGGYSKFDDYQVNAGGNGGDGSVSFSSPTHQGSYTVGAAGSTATFTSGGTNIAKYVASSYHYGDSMISTSMFYGITGPDGQSGGSTIGNYGTGGKGGDCPDSGGTIRDSTYYGYGENGQPGAIIIRKL